MKISSKKIKMLREEKGWSQEHLSEAAGLSYRTIQRIEKSGQCSLESQMAVASALLVSPIELADEYSQTIGSGKIQWEGITGIVICALLVTLNLALGGSVTMALDVPSLVMAIILPLALSLLSNGAMLTWQATKIIGWLFYESKGEKDVHHTIPTFRKLIIYSYASGLIGALLALLSSVNFYTDMTPIQFSNSIQVALLPIVYSVLLAEIVFRPIQHKISRLVVAQAS
ncbi:helix-turn-helix domain-containing protein [Psychrobium sp. MM17-31]|uniref:helix-turn-helix domain-containing protein n=1 Tax=Psychrobium sp. MM17-31 TaxID=2917758 RepID=UPI001EF5E184|nr:helix-turn-helix transcriptional regulator [Psychrobium sp. MM17-31]MCG7532135.1 helix-turn-helix domain-containing protein [Psychrobium sp. MM17-31]